MFSTRWWQVVLLAVGLAWAYFALFPEDLDAVLAPITRLLILTGAIESGFYAVLAAALIAWAIVRVWGNPIGR